jgi:hypothetical protein
MFASTFKELSTSVPLPSFHGLRILMMPIIFGDNSTVPYHDVVPMLDVMSKYMEIYKGNVVYLTIDQKELKSGETHRRQGLHVDGYPLTDMDDNGGSWGGGGGGWGGGKGRDWCNGSGLLTVSDVEGCRAWNQTFYGVPKPEGDCEHLRDECVDDYSEILKPYTLYWLSPSCVHESIPISMNNKRTFVRLSLPSECDWHEGCTPNPLGVKPTGRVKPQRRFMNL